MPGNLHGPRRGGLRSTSWRLASRRDVTELPALWPTAGHVSDFASTAFIGYLISLAIVWFLCSDAEGGQFGLGCQGAAELRSAAPTAPMPISWPTQWFLGVMLIYRIPPARHVCTHAKQILRSAGRGPATGPIRRPAGQPAPTAPMHIFLRCATDVWRCVHPRYSACQTPVVRTLNTYLSADWAMHLTQVDPICSISVQDPNPRYSRSLE